MSVWEILIAVAAASLIVLVVSRYASTVVIHEYERGVLYSRGRLSRVLSAGRYWILRPVRSVQVVDMRSRAVSIPGQEVLSADNVSVKTSMALRYRVTSPETSLQNAQSFQDALYLEAQLVLRDLISGLPVDDLLQNRGQIAAQLRERLEPSASALGLALETVGVKDITFPGGLKHTFAQVVEARKSAQAALERARGETATLRHLANAARMLEGNPALMALKTLQTAAEGKHTFVLGLPQSVIPVTRERELPAGEPAAPPTEPPED